MTADPSPSDRLTLSRATIETVLLLLDNLPQSLVRDSVIAELGAALDRPPVGGEDGGLAAAVAHVAQMKPPSPASEGAFEHEAIARAVCGELFAPGSRLSTYEAVLAALNRLAASQPKAPSPPGSEARDIALLLSLNAAAYFSDGQKQGTLPKCSQEWQEDLCDLFRGLLAAQPKASPPPTQGEVEEALAHVEGRLQYDASGKGDWACTECNEPEPRHKPSCELATLRTLAGQQGQWQPIETAPKDGRCVVLLLQSGFAKSPGTREVGYWTDHNGGGWVTARPGMAVAWCELPPLPAPPPADGGGA